jgi:hypothetical protein
MNDSRYRRDSCKQAEGRIQIGIVPIDVHAGPGAAKGDEGPTVPIPQRVAKLADARRNCVALPVAC